LYGAGWEQAAVIEAAESLFQHKNGRGPALDRMQWGNFQLGT
jgi:hypothetical protein